MDGIQFVAKVSVNNGVLKVDLGFWERVGGLSKSFEVDLKNISAVEIVARPTWRTLGWRLGGTHIPAVVALGHFSKSKKRMLVFWVKGKDAVVIDLKTGPLNRLIIGSTDSKALAKSLKN